ncbi:flagellar basal-body MS-ring/collar protein FliF [Abyssibacter sp.]|uniref:flagellar basal-body MS-ring/collar protein FliF n=1 Tax=Abyssibacter sp. TaxID=2320200 RepID=UPI0025C739C4|nr:flagellar basal-body MS-ring/collar protein FliF [Abyssibacter sp.]MCK5858509.1 flagellar M-ring protein FliF [Abyssibacter sp.]
MTDTATQDTLAQRLKQVPGLRQLMLLVGIAGAVAIGVTVYFWAQSPTLVPVYSGLAERDMSAMADALAAQGIDYKMDIGRGSVLVRGGDVQTARLTLASQGLPQGAGVGFESMQENPGLGVSQFMESARYQHSLETELSRTIMSLQPVDKARVHLAVPKPSPFVRQKREPTASVVVQLFPGRSLERTQIAAIQHLVSAGVPSLEPGRVSVVDHSGRLLSSGEQDSALAITNKNFEHTRRVEQAFSDRIRELLAPMVGAGRLSVQVTADMNYAVQEETVERYAPDAAIRSEQTSEDSSAGTVPTGVPGATTNKPQGLPGTTPVPTESQVAAAGAVRRQSVRNYELDKTTSYLRESVGRLQRVSAAVLVDHVPTRDPEGQVAMQALPADQLARIEALVREAIGFDAARGDSVSVMNAPFLNEIGQLEDVAPAPLWQQPWVTDLARQSGGVLLVIIILMALVRPMLKSLLASPAQMLGGQQMALAGAGGDAAMLGMAGEERVSLSPQAAAAGSRGHQALTDQSKPFAIDLAAPYEDQVSAVRQVVNEDPKRVAQVVRQWVNDGE